MTSDKPCSLRITMLAVQAGGCGTHACPHAFAQAYTCTHAHMHTYTHAHTHSRRKAEETSEAKVLSASKMAPSSVVSGQNLSLAIEKIAPIEQGQHRAETAAGTAKREVGDMGEVEITAQQQDERERTLQVEVNANHAFSQNNSFSTQERFAHLTAEDIRSALEVAVMHSRTSLHTCMHTCMYASKHAHILAHLHAHMHTSLHACTHACMLHACMHACTAGGGVPHGQGDTAAKEHHAPGRSVFLRMCCYRFLGS